MYEPKKRTIYVLPFFPDRIVQHAIMNVLEPIWDNLLISDSYACRKNKGQHAGSDKCMEFVRRYEYCLKCDISKFYPSMRHDIMKEIIRKKIKDRKMLNLLDNIIDSIGGETNIPIGNFISQWFGNLYLNELDMFLKHEKRVKAYIRYCDDFCLFSDDKKELHRLLNDIKEFTASRLKMKLSKSDVFKTTQGVDFLGYRHFHQGYILVRKSTSKRIFRRIRNIKSRLAAGTLKKIERAIGQIDSAMGWLMHANTFNMKNKLDLLNLRKIILSDKLNPDEVPDFKEIKKKNSNSLTGEKISIQEILGKLIIVKNYRVFPSTVMEGKTCLQLQIQLEDGSERVVFSNSGILIKQLNEQKEFKPFKTIIVKKFGENNYYVFT